MSFFVQANGELGWALLSSTRRCRRRRRRQRRAKLPEGAD